MMMKQNLSQSPSTIETLIHIIGWGIVFGFPFFMMNRSGSDITWSGYLHHGCIIPLAFFFIFYLNYCWLIPRYLFKSDLRAYLLFNAVFILVIAFGAHFWQEYTFVSAGAPRMKRPDSPPKWVFILRDVFSMILTVGLCAAIRMSRRWTAVENARREAEQSRTEAELKNLRNQLNPHFLLNTLNNIYALIAFDTDKAQQAVQELSRLLRHVLYDNQQNLVPLHKEMDFIRNYIALMRIRLAANVTVETRFDIPADNSVQIAPLIFISLIENAFKHGISPTEPSYIRIRFSLDGDKVNCEITNSYHPKTATDKSGSGIGLEQVRRRLELSYAGRYTWQQGTDPLGKEYRSFLSIHTADSRKTSTRPSIDNPSNPKTCL